MPAKRKTRRGPGRPRKAVKKKVNYKRRYAKFGKTPAAKAAKVRRQRDRRRLIREGKLKKGSKKHVHHSGPGGTGRVSIISAKKNLSKKEGSRRRGSKRRTKNWGK